ncbi:MAG: hypothetical protein OXJ52_06230 [Oligoflexia bacterium]|nr:hypothetical protein [Oligoflexia bacterium]
MKLFLQIYYSLLFCVLYKQAYRFINFIQPLEPDYIFFAKPLSFFKLPVEIHSVIFLLALFFCLLSVFSHGRTLRVLTSLFVLVLFSIMYSYGKISHSEHAFILSSALVCFFSESKSLNSSWNFFVLRLIQGLVLSHYFISGLWKLREMISSRFEFSLQEIAMESIAHSLAEQNIHFILKFLLEEPWLLSFGYFCVLVFQLTALTPIFLNRFFKLYGALAVLFHLSTGISVITYFASTVLGVLFFLVIAESMRKYEI